MLLREVVGRGVFDVAGAQTIAKVRTVVVEPSEQRVVGFRIDGPSPILPLRNVKAVGHDKITIGNADALHQPSTVADQRSTEHDLDPIGARVLADDGTELGKAEDLDFNPERGTIDAIVVNGTRLAGTRLLGIGPYALVVAAE